MKQNIYDNETFFKAYNGMRLNQKGYNANDLIEIPTIRGLMPSLQGKKILDLGCGAGENAQYFMENGASYVLAIDISENMIQIARENNKYDNVIYKVMPMEDILSIGEKFDIVVSSLAIHYIEDLEKLLNDIHALLESGGYFIFSQEHPIATGTILNSSCNGTDAITLDEKNYYLVSNYNENGKRIVDWNDCEVVKYHRNFSFIINTIHKCFFEIEEVLEPTPSDETLQIKPAYKNQFDRPFFLFLKIKKK